MEDSKTLPKPPDVPVMPPEVRVISDKLRGVYQQLGIHYNIRDKAQKTIDQLEAQLEALKDALSSVQRKDD